VKPSSRPLAEIAAIALYPTVAIVGFVIFSRIVVGGGSCRADFFVPENKALGLRWWRSTKLPGVRGN